MINHRIILRTRKFRKTMKVKAEKRCTFEVELIKPTIPGIGLICTPRSLSITLPPHKANLKCKIDSKHGMLKGKYGRKGVLMMYLNLSILDHGLVCPFTAQFPVHFKIFTMRLHIEFMFYLPFHWHLTYKRIFFGVIFKESNSITNNQNDNSWADFCACIFILTWSK